MRYPYCGIRHYDCDMRNSECDIKRHSDCDIQRYCDYEIFWLRKRDVWRYRCSDCDAVTVRYSGYEKF